jgi:hypothetical protein
MDEHSTGSDEHWWDDPWSREFAIFVGVWIVLLVIGAIALLVFNTAIYRLLT